MKRLFLIMVVMLLSSSASAQTEEVKGFQWGVAYKQETAVLGLQASANATAGYRFNRGNYLGFQTGYTFVGSSSEMGSFGRYWGMPLLVDFIHYFPMGKKKQNSFFTGVEGGGYIIGFYSAYTQKTFTNFGYYACVKNGFDFNIADFTHLQLGVLLSYPGMGVSIGFTF
jgi:hypothetical protein